MNVIDTYHREGTFTNDSIKDEILGTSFQRSHLLPRMECVAPKVGVFHLFVFIVTL